MLFGILIFFQVLVAFILVFLVMLQGGRGAELGAAFGGVGQSQTVRGTMSGIAKATAVAGALFMILSLTLAYLSSEKATDSVVKGIQAPAVPAEETQTSSSEAATASQAEEATSEAEISAPELEQTEAPPLSTDEKSEN